jgi:hypothetical protein
MQELNEFQGEKERNIVTTFAAYARSRARMHREGAVFLDAVAQLPPVQAQLSSQPYGLAPMVAGEAPRAIQVNGGPSLFGV